MPFIKVSCASLSEGIIESELFGHEKGAFTGAVTSRKGGLNWRTAERCFWMRVEDIPPSTQIKLLRVSRRVNLKEWGE